MKPMDKDILICFGTAFFISYLFFYVNQNSVHNMSDFYFVHNMSDFYLFHFGIFFPFIIAIAILIKKRLEEPSYIWGF